MARLPVYLRTLVDLHAQQTATISSERLAELAGVNAAKVRKDLSYLGSYGTRGVGYDVEYLVFQMRRALGLTHEWPVAIVGVGNLGAALANYGGFGERGFPVAALVDADPAKVGTTLGGHAIHHLDELPELVPELGIAIGIITTPAGPAQDVADRLVAAGVTSILNFAPAVISVEAPVIAAQGRPGPRAADPQLLPPARGRRRRGCGPATGGTHLRGGGLSVPVGAPLYPVGLVVAGRRCLVVGGGAVALQKVRELVACGAVVDVVAPEVCDELSALDGPAVHRRPYRRGEAADYRLVLTTTGDPDVDRPGPRRRRGRRRLGEQRRRPGELLVHPPRPGPPGAPARHRRHRRREPGAGHLAAPSPPGRARPGVPHPPRGPAGPEGPAAPPWRAHRGP